MTVAAYDYIGLRVIAYPRRAPPKGLKDDTWPIGPNTVTQHLDRFWMPIVSIIPMDFEEILT